MNYQLLQKKTIINKSSNSNKKNHTSKIHCLWKKKDPKYHIHKPASIGMFTILFCRTKLRDRIFYGKNNLGDISARRIHIFGVLFF
jgi:hypothetical protein